MTESTRSETARFFILDALRLVAALMVVAYHYLGRNQSSWGTNPSNVFPFASEFAAYGGLGVQLFFIISGFVILMSADGRGLGSFVASRIGRLFPAYWFAVLATAFMITWLARPGEFREFTLSGLLINLTMTQSAFGVPHIDGVYWTLWVELLFYILIAFFVWRGITEGRILLLAFLWPLIGALSMASDGFLEEVLIPKYSPFFAAGMVIYLIYRNGHSLIRWLVLGFTMAAGTTQGVNHWVLTTMSEDTGRELSPVVGAVILLAFFAVVILVTLTPLAHIGPAWFARAGALTYPLYLLHQYWGWWLIARLYPALGKWETLIIAVGVMMIAAALVERLVERPLGPKLGRAIRKALHTEVPRRDERELTSAK